jgi:DNA-binding transcriptional MerR regulator
MNKIKLTELVELGNTQREIADKMNCSQSNIRHWMKKYGLKSKNFKIGEKEFYSSDNFLDMQRKNSNWNYDEIQKLYDSGLSWREVSKIHKISTATIFNKICDGLLKSRNLSESSKIHRNKKQYKHTEESKRKISESRKKWLKENPDKHPWKSNNKFKSEPCEKVKEFLKKLNIQFISEFDPNIEGRNFSIDIAIPDKKIALEINGNQHYEKTGELKTYYKERHDLLEKNDWNVYQIHYSSCFNLEKWTDFINQLKNSPVKIEFDYFNYVPKNKKIHPKCVCGKEKTFYAKFCLTCMGLNNRKVKNRPSKEELEKLIWEKPFTELGKQFGVSDNAIRKWCKDYGITKFPDITYRQKQFHSKK